MMDYILVVISHFIKYSCSAQTESETASKSAALDSISVLCLFDIIDWARKKRISAHFTSVIFDYDTVYWIEDISDICLTGNLKCILSSGNDDLEDYARIASSGNINIRDLTKRITLAVLFIVFSFTGLVICFIVGLAVCLTVCFIVGLAVCLTVCFIVGLAVCLTVCFIVGLAVCFTVIFCAGVFRLQILLCEDKFTVFILDVD